MLGLGVDADRPSTRRPHLGRQRDDLGQRRHLELAVVGRRARAQVRQALACPERLDLGQRQVLGEPARHLTSVDGLGGPAVGELGAVGDVGRARHLVLVARDQDPVARGDHVGLDDVGTLLDRQPVGGQRVLRAPAARPPVRDHEHVGARRAHLPCLGRQTLDPDHADDRPDLERAHGPRLDLGRDADPEPLDLERVGQVERLVRLAGVGAQDPRAALDGRVGDDPLERDRGAGASGGVGDGEHGWRVGGGRRGPGAGGQGRSDHQGEGACHGGRGGIGGG